jgi:hypothetical protein
MTVYTVLFTPSFKQQFPFKDNGEVHPSTIALRDAFHSFPVSADALLIDATHIQIDPPPRLFLETDKYKGPIWTLIAHHVAQLPSKQFTYHGIHAMEDLRSYFPLLVERFALDDENYYENSIRNLSFTGCSTLDSLEIVDFILFDIREHPAIYGKYLADSLFMDHRQGLINQFKKEIDFNALYGLKPDPVLPLEEWTRIDSRTALFVNMWDGKPPAFEERQSAVCDIKLIPKVTGDIQITFQRAKDAYVLGYFRYDFFTVALHYASLALEAAIKARWTASLPPKVVLTHGIDQIEMSFPSHTKISDLRRTKKWDLRKVRIDGEPFPCSTRMLLNWLEDGKIVSVWERKCLKNGLELRNELSHVERSSTNTPASDDLRFLANQINSLFHSLP